MAEFLTPAQRHTLENPGPMAYVVISDAGNRASFFDPTRAAEAAARCHGIIVPVFPPAHLLQRKSDAPA